MVPRAPSPIRGDTRHRDAHGVSPAHSAYVKRRVATLKAARDASPSYPAASTRRPCHACEARSVVGVGTVGRRGSCRIRCPRVVSGNGRGGGGNDDEGPTGDDGATSGTGRRADRADGRLLRRHRRSLGHGHLDRRPAVQQYVGGRACRRLGSTSYCCKMLWARRRMTAMFSGSRCPCGCEHRLRRRPRRGANGAGSRWSNGRG